MYILFYTVRQAPSTELLYYNMLYNPRLSCVVTTYYIPDEMDFSFHRPTSTPLFSCRIIIIFIVEWVRTFKLISIMAAIR